MNHNTILLAMAALLPGTADAQSAAYPTAPADGTTYTSFGRLVDDRYRPLENDTAAATAAWVEAENAVTAQWLEKVAYRRGIRNRLEQLNDYTKQGLPSLEADGKYYFSRNEGLRNQSVIYRSSTPDGADAEVFLDPNTLSDDGTVALTGLYMSNDGRYMAYTVSRSGSDWSEIYVMDTATRQLLEDHIEWAKFTSAEWRGDGFYYNAYPRPAAGKEFSNANLGHSIYYHRIGTPQSADELVYSDPEHPLQFHTAQMTHDERYLIVNTSGNGHGNALKVRDLTLPDAPWVTIVDKQDEAFEAFDTTPDGRLLVFTTIGAPRNRIVSIDPHVAGLESLIEVVPEQSDVLDGVKRAGDALVLTYSKDAANRLYVHELDGQRRTEIELPTYGTVSVSTSRKSPEIFYAFTSFTYPTTAYSYNTINGQSKKLYSSGPANFNPEDYVTEQVFYPSADGTMIPMFLTYKRGLERNGANPVYLYGYGGFNIALNPTFSANRLFWLENGGIYAQANLRGGSEYGEEWHQAGTKQQKLNVFHDFIAAGEYLIEQGWTSPERLVIEGGSNGGLLVGACVNLRPDLFAVAIPRVGVMDMMRYHLFTIGWNWAHDYGTADDSPAMSDYLLSYSPLHNIRNDGTPYPAILVTTADHDDRVVPAHSFKYAAALQAANTGSQPKLIRIDSKAGHGAGKPIAKVLDEWTDIYSFVFSNLGITPASAK